MHTLYMARARFKIFVYELCLSYARPLTEPGLTPWSRVQQGLGAESTLTWCSVIWWWNTRPTLSPCSRCGAPPILDQTVRVSGGLQMDVGVSQAGHGGKTGAKCWNSGPRQENQYSVIIQCHSTEQKYSAIIQCHNAEPKYSAIIQRQNTVP